LMYSQNPLWVKWFAPQKVRFMNHMVSTKDFPFKYMFIMEYISTSHIGK
jgi:hypothetical protein